MNEGLVNIQLTKIYAKLTLVEIFAFKFLLALECCCCTSAVKFSSVNFAVIFTERTI